MPRWLSPFSFRPNIVIALALEAVDSESYEKMTLGTFNVKVDGRDFTVQTQVLLRWAPSSAYSTTAKVLSKTSIRSSKILSTHLQLAKCVADHFRGGCSLELLLGGVLRAHDQGGVSCSSKRDIGLLARWSCQPNVE